MMESLIHKLRRERRFWISITVVLVVLTFIISLKNAGYRRKLAITQHHEKQLNKEMEDLRNSLKISGNLLPSYLELYSWDIERLKKKGLEAPIKDIITDLMNHKELIPYEGTLGGTMGFYHEDNIHILSPKWVFTYFEDGHTGGHMLLEYQVSNEGRISWKVIDSYLDYMLE